MRGREQRGLQPGQYPPDCDGDPEPPPAPRGLQAMALSTFAIRVFWEPPPSNGDITGYVLHLRPVGGGCGWVDGNP